MSQGLKAQLKKLQDAKQYEAMIVLLEASNEPNKAQVIARIRQRMKEEAPVPVMGNPLPVKGKPLPGTGDAPEVRRVGGCQHVTRLVIFTMVAIPVIFLAGHALNSYMKRYQWRMEEVCRTVYRADWLDGTYTFNQWFYGCQSAAAQSLNFYGEAIAYCYASQNGTERMFMQCLATEDVSIHSAKLSETAP